MNENFKKIAPYDNNELPAAISRLCANADFVRFVQQFLPEMTQETLFAHLSQARTTTEVHRICGYKWLTWLIENRTSGFTFSGLENCKFPTLFVSNHRDIVLDPSLLNYILMSQNLETAEMGIGDNLLVLSWLDTFIRIAKCFLVQRSLPPREVPQALLQLSAYIRYAITQKGSSVWIAQREGRAKDSNDRTQESILKMFAISGEKSFIENLKELNISPLSISYEFDPCDYLKAKEFQQKRDDANYKKTPADDALNMKTGIWGFKGRVNYAFLPSINDDLDKIAAKIANRREQVAAVAALIDKKIHQNYAIFPINKVAYDLLLGKNRFAADYSAEEKAKTEAYFEQQLAKIDLPNADKPFLRQKLLEMYANPLINFLSVKSEAPIP